MRLRPFHLAVPVDDLATADAFYHGVLGCAHGRRSDAWIDYDFFGHQLVAHLSPADCKRAATNAVDGEDVPARHFGIVMEPHEWRALGEKLKRRGVKFLIPPTVRFKGEAGEQGTFFLFDPAGNALEFKCFENLAQMFAT
jgi:extradiol dioxygenase family protein